MSDTPETDALMDVWRVGKLLSVGVMLDHARKLERERDEARNIARWLYQHGMATLKEGAYRRPWVKEVIQ